MKLLTTLAVLIAMLLASAPASLAEASGNCTGIERADVCPDPTMAAQAPSGEKSAKCLALFVIPQALSVTGRPQAALAVDSVASLRGSDPCTERRPPRV